MFLFQVSVEYLHVGTFFRNCIKNALKIFDVAEQKHFIEAKMHF